MNAELKVNRVEARQSALVLGAPIDILDWKTALYRISDWAARRESRYVCICNVHSVVSTTQDAEFATVQREADMATADGAPVAWLIRRLGHSKQGRINGPDLMWLYCSEAEKSGQGIFLYGGSSRTLDILKEKLILAFPALNISGAYSPPFRELTGIEDAEIVDLINASGAGTVWVSLGCPKQEKWMAAHRGRINAVMVGVGAAFDYHAQTIKRAPLWMQRGGLEWLHRLCSEPRRLWRRYFITNTLFILGAVKQLIHVSLREK